MNIIVVSRRLSSPRTLNLKERRVWLPLAAAGSGVVLVIMGVTLVLVASTFNRFLDRANARRAAEIFDQDLSVARNAAARTRQTVVLDFDESALTYVARTTGGDTLFRRSFDGDSDLRLSAMDLQFSGDTLAFGSRGMADLSGALGALGRAAFTAGNVTYAVFFNSMGSSRIDES